MIRFLIELSEEEADALSKLSKQNIRSPRDQVRFMIAQELIRLNYLEGEGNDNKLQIKQEKIPMFQQFLLRLISR